MLNSGHLPISIYLPTLIWSLDVWIVISKSRRDVEGVFCQLLIFFRNSISIPFSVLLSALCLSSVPNFSDSFCSYLQYFQHERPLPYHVAFGPRGNQSERSITSHFFIFLCENKHVDALFFAARRTNKHTFAFPILQLVLG